MLVSCILLSSNKPQYVCEAINSVLGQTHKDTQLVIFDSGELFDLGFFGGLPTRASVIRSWETEETREDRAIAPWSFNQVWNSKCVRGDLVCWLCDDDYYLPKAFETFNTFFTENPSAMCCYGHQYRSVIDGDGERVTGELHAVEMRGQSCKGRPLDCEVDYCQVCVRRQVLQVQSWVEDLAYETHSDGVTLERIGERWPFHPVPVFVSVNRRTPLSTFTPSH